VSEKKLTIGVKKKRETAGLYAGDKEGREGEKEIFAFAICKSDELEMGLPC
jgi:hypothetical protein